MTTAAAPDNTSADYDVSKPYLDMVETILKGTDAMREAGEAYLPQFPNETPDDYDYRRVNAKFTNVYSDIVSTLASKPFSDECQVNDDAGERIKALAEDIDGRGNNLHVFAENTFYNGLNYAIDWIVVDYAKVGPGASLADEKRIGARPYWIHVPAQRMLAVYSATIAGQEAFVHARMKETSTARVGFDEVTTERIRIFDRAPIYDAEGKNLIGYSPATFEVWEKRVSAGRRKSTSWEIADSGPITIGVIPIVPFIAGRRIGGSWRFQPPLKDAAFLQIEHYQQETALKCAREMTAFPMLAGNGVAPAMVDGKPAPVPVSPKSVLYAPPSGDNGSHGEWRFIEPDATSLKFLSGEVDKTEAQLRELGRQPLMATSGITVVAAAFASQKASSVLQSWALRLKDALEQAFKLTAMWLNDSAQPTVRLFTDFDLDMTDEKGPEVLTKMRESGDLSQGTLWAEMKRRGILGPDFEAEKERDLIVKEMPDADGADDITGAIPPPGNDDEDTIEAAAA